MVATNLAFVPPQGQLPIIIQCTTGSHFNSLLIQVDECLNHIAVEIPHSYLVDPNDSKFIILQYPKKQIF